MTDRKILEIQLDDSAFTDFKAKFDQYKAEVAKLPESWRHSGANISAQSANFAKMQASLRQQAERLASIGRGTLNTGKDVAIADLAWTRIFHSSKLFATNLHRSTMELARWTKLTAVFSGLLGAGGLFGITRMAQGVASRATSARGLGVTYRSPN